MLLEEYFYFSIIPFIDKLHQWINDFFSFFIDKMSVIYRNQVDLTFDAAGTNKKKLHSSPYIVRERRRRWFGYGSVMVRSWLDHGSVMAWSWLGRVSPTANTSGVYKIYKPDFTNTTLGQLNNVQGDGESKFGPKLDYLLVHLRWMC